MFLKRIVLHGFKSFADRTEFDFGPGLTGIVGPNGCGKSNVLDAVRWVLGEQSAKTLRGTRMQDVIFSGSRSRRAAAFAEVELTFDNSSRRLALDHPEVSVGRILFINGESEYRLNGESVRLKDVRDLLLDTGIGVDAYSVIEQGRVDALLQASPIERREIFEEAAGVSRYKVRRGEAQRKLERTQNNLLRLNDVLDELEKRLRSVKLAAGKARNYLEVDARLRALKATAYFSEHRELSSLERTLALEAAALDDVLAARRAEFAQRDGAAATLSADAQQLDAQIETADTELMLLRNEAAMLTERIAQGRQRQSELSETRQRLLLGQREAEEMLQQLAVLEQQHAIDLADVSAAAQQQSSAVAELAAQRGEVEQRRAAQQRRLDETRRAATEVERQAAVIAMEATAMQDRRLRVEQRLEHLAQRQAVLQGEAAALTERQRDHQTAIELLTQQVAEASGRLEQVEQNLQQVDAALAAVQRSLAELKERRSGLRSRLGVLEELEQRLDGVAQGARWVLDAVREAPGQAGVVGLVADVLRIDDQRVERLSGVLSAFEDAIVVRDVHVFLAELARHGRLPGDVRVILMDSDGARSRWRVSPDAPGVLAAVADWVRCEPEFRGVAEDLLGDVWLVDCVERGLALAAQSPPSARFVAPDGCVVAAGRLFLPGATPGLGLISRRATIRQLQLELEECDGQLDASSRQRATLEASRDDLRLQREAIAAERTRLERQRGDAQTQQLRCADELGRTERATADVLADQQRASAELAELGERLGALRSREQEQSRSAAALGEQIVAMQRDLTEIEDELSARGATLTQAMVEAGRLTERRNAIQREQENLRRRSAALQQEQTQASAAAEQALARLAVVQDEQLAAAEQLRQVRIQADASDGRVAVLREARLTLRRRLESSGATARRLQADIDGVDAALRGRQVALREAQVRIENVAQRVREELALELEQLAPGATDLADPAAVREEIEALRGRIARLGHVNLDSIAELEEIGPRHDNLSAQREDLVESVRQIEALIAELDQESRTRFLSAYEQIRLHFQELFRKVFGGGKADIILENPENPENPLECGIDIIARPPGKEPQSISLLSGGERTMTAIALLLAVFRSKPSPFAVMDEVDAALDEANTERFTHVLEEFLEHSQFVVITHSKRTMQSADVLYGVTMEEPGVSKRVSVRLDERVDTPVEA